MFYDTISHEVGAANAVFVTFVYSERCVGAHNDTMLAFDYIIDRYDCCCLVVAIAAIVVVAIVVVIVLFILESIWNLDYIV